MWSRQRGTMTRRQRLTNESIENAASSGPAVHEHYVRAINDAVHAGRDADVYELAAAYDLESQLPPEADLAA
jgi:hypothetical protein